MKGIPPAILFSLLLPVAGCRNAQPLDDADPAGSDEDPEDSTDGEADSDTGGDTSTAVDTDAETDADTGSAPGTDSDTPGETDTGTGPDTGSGPDTDTGWDTGTDWTPIPCIYECVATMWSCGERGSMLHPEMFCPDEDDLCCEGWKLQDEWPCLICSEPFPSHSAAPVDLTRAFPGLGPDPVRLTPRGK